MDHAALVEEIDDLRGQLARCREHLARYKAFADEVEAMPAMGAGGDWHDGYRAAMADLAEVRRNHLRGVASDGRAS